MTLMALSLAIGMLIDDAIVVRENIVRHVEHGEDHYTAAGEGTSEIGFAVLATTMSVLAVFIPVGFMGGIIGKFFFQFGITVAFAIAVSLFVSFTLDQQYVTEPSYKKKKKKKNELLVELQCDVVECREVSTTARKDLGDTGKPNHGFSL